MAAMQRFLKGAEMSYCLQPPSLQSHLSITFLKLSLDYLTHQTCSAEVVSGAGAGARDSKVEGLLPARLVKRQTGLTMAVCSPHCWVSRPLSRSARCCSDGSHGLATKSVHSQRLRGRIHGCMLFHAVPCWPRHALCSMSLSQHRVRGAVPAELHGKPATCRHTSFPRQVMHKPA